MPTVLRVGAFRFFFYSADGKEPPHIHIGRGDAVAKFWLDPVLLVTSRGFHRADLREIERLVEARRRVLMEAWSEFFDR